MEELILTIHILSAAAWIGTSLFFGYAGPRFRDIGGPPVAGWIKVVLGSIPRFVAPAGILTGVSGALLVVVDESWQWSDAFVGIGLAVVVVVLAIGLSWNVPNLRRALASLETGDMPAVGAAMKKVSQGGMLIVVLLIATEFVMVYRLGSG